jgi:hypothetical protein
MSWAIILGTAAQTALELATSLFERVGATGSFVTEGTKHRGTKANATWHGAAPQRRLASIQWGIGYLLRRLCAVSAKPTGLQTYRSARTAYR